MKENILFISDLHLSAKTTHINALFDHFLTDIAPSATALFILGDFFEYWLGEDVMDAFQKSTLEKLHALSQTGIPLYFIHGNRDFLLSKKTLGHYGIQLLQDGQILSLCGKKILLCHGDHLCTLDIPYQRYKKIVRAPLIQWLFLHLRKAVRLNIARKIHDKNPHGNRAANPNYSIADTTPTAIQKEITLHHPDLIIHGHTHRMAEHQHDDTIRFVLGDWNETGNYLELTQDSCRMRTVFLAH